MATPDVPQTGTSRLLNPRRSAHATIRGYLYQTCLGVLRWLDLQPDEILLCEGDEDLDRFLLGGGSVSEQVKAYTGGLSLSDRAVLESLGNFLRSYVTLRQRGETRKFVFTTTAQEKRTTAKGLDFDLLTDWKAGKRTKKIVAGVRSLLKPQKKTGKHGKETTDAIAWLDGQPEGWKDFMDVVEWSFDAPDLDGVRQRIKERLALREGTNTLPAETFLERLISHAFSTSIQPNAEDRQLTSKNLYDLVEIARRDLGYWVKTPAAERLRAVFDELQQVQHLLYDNIARLPKNAAPGKLLTAAYEVIPFDQAGRREEFDFLTDWCKDEERGSVLLLTGEGGSGKTRLMIEWCRHLRHQGWHAGFLRQDREAADLDPLLEGVASRLVVVDYAETRLEVVEPLLLKMGLATESGYGPKLRLVLLARRPAEWWTKLPRKRREIEDILLGSPEPRAITPLIPKDLEGRARVLQAAVEGFSLQMEMDRKRTRAVFIPDLTSADFGRVLYLHMAALAIVRGEHIESAEGALQQTLDHERIFWSEQVSGLALDGILAPLISEALESVMAAITLIGGAKSLKQAKALSRRSLRNSILEEQHLAAILGILRQLYAGFGNNGAYIDPLQPDLLGEELLAQTLSIDDEFPEKILTGSDQQEAYSVSTVLTRLAQRRPNFEDWIGIIPSKPPEALALNALNPGTEVEYVIESDPLKEVIHVASRKDTELLQESLIELNKVDRSEHIALPHNWDKGLKEISRREDALQEVVRTYVLLGQQLFDSRPDIAHDFHDLIILLTKHQRQEEALKTLNEVVQLLSQEGPDASRPDLAKNLNNLGVLHSELGQDEDALREITMAIQIYRLLAQQSPNTFLPDLAISLNNLGNTLNELGRREDALNATNEALQIRRLLAQQRPDAFRPNLARSLSIIGNTLSELGRHEDALTATNEAVQIYRLLAQQQPDAFLPDLAVSLNNLSVMYSALGWSGDALNAINEVVQIYQSLMQQQPDVFRHDLATSLTSQGILLSELGRNEEAFQTSEEAIHALLPFSFRLPAAFIVQMAKMVINYLERAEALGREPDETLLAPIRKVLRALFQKQEPHEAEE